MLLIAYAYIKKNLMILKKVLRLLEPRFTIKKDSIEIIPVSGRMINFKNSSDNKEQEK